MTAILISEQEAKDVVKGLEYAIIALKTDYKKAIQLHRLDFAMRFEQASKLYSVLVKDIKRRIK
jgi:hypothetical protein